MITPHLTLDHLSLQFPMMDKMILHDIHYQITPGDFVIILGGNGSGKSSLLKLIDKRYMPTSGRVLYHGTNINALRDNAYFQSVKTLTQSTVDSLFPTLTVMENYKLFSLANKQQNAHALSTSQCIADYLSQFNTQLPNKLEQQVLFLSGGEKQALVLALTMLHPPAILLLDEHTSALDPKSAEVIIQLTNEMVRKHHITCLLTTHDLAIAARYGDRLLALKEGKMYRTLEKEQKEVLTASDLRALCY